jgi:hypothetical protein
MGDHLLSLAKLGWRRPKRPGDRNLVMELCLVKFFNDRAI